MGARTPIAQAFLNHRHVFTASPIGTVGASHAPWVLNRPHHVIGLIIKDIKYNDRIRITRRDSFIRLIIPSSKRDRIIAFCY